MDHLESLFERALDAVVGMDQAGKVIAWNAAAEEIFGWNRSEALGCLMGDLIVPAQHRASHSRGLQHYNKTGEGPVLEKRVKITGLHRDGREFPVELSIFPMHDEDRNTCFYAFIRSRALEEAILREQTLRAEEGKALLAVAQKLLEDVSLEDFTQFCLEIACTVAGMEAGHLQVVRGTGTGARLYPSNIWHFSESRFEPVIEATNGFRFACGEGVPGRAWETGELQVVEDVGKSPKFLRRNAFAAVGLSRTVALPIWRGHDVHGVLEFFGTASARLDPEILRMIATIGSQIGVAIQRKEHAEHREILRREMMHRVGNSLTVLASIYRSCSRTAATKEELDDSFLDRLMAVAGANRLTVESATDGAWLTELIGAATDVFPDQNRVAVHSIDLMVQHDSVMPLALVLNELATNTLKHNDLGEVDRLVIHVSLDNDHVVLNWHEIHNGGPSRCSASPARSGFGTKLLHLMIDQQLAGSFERHFDEKTFHVNIRIPRVRLEGTAVPIEPNSARTEPSEPLELPSTKEVRNSDGAPGKRAKAHAEKNTLE